LSKALRAGWLPKITNGWFFRAENFFSVARYQDKVNTEIIPGVPPGTPPDYLSHSHGEGEGPHGSRRAALPRSSP
jgi:predicted ATPase